MSVGANQQQGTENIYILDENYQYNAATQTANAKWLDTANVMSVKRDKTIYAIRARNDFNWVNANTSSSFFANTISIAPGQLTLSSNLFRGFGTVLNGDVENILMTKPYNVYGNVEKVTTNSNPINTANALGIAGDLLNKNFVYADNGSGRINVQSNVKLFLNSANANMSPFLPTQLNYVNNAWTDVSGNAVNGNTALANLAYAPNWNRLINANLGGNIVVTASTDPIDCNGNPIPFSNILINTASATTNEAYRHQFQLQGNTLGATKNASNPIYIMRIDRFGVNGLKNSDGSSYVDTTNLSLDSFSSNFFARLGVDNALYANAQSNNLINKIIITGNVSSTPFPNSFNGNWLGGNIGNLNGTLQNVSQAIVISNRGSILDTIDSNIDGSGLLDTLNNIQENKNFKDADKITIIQGNLNLSRGVYLYNRIFPNSTNAQVNANFITANTVFSGDQNMSASTYAGTVSNLPNLYYSNANLINNNSYEQNAKFLIIKGNAIPANNNNVSNVTYIDPKTIAVPTVDIQPNYYNNYNNDQVCLYLRRGNMASNENYTYLGSNINPVANVYVKTVPEFLANVVEPSGQVSLIDANVAVGGNLWANANLQLSFSVGSTPINANIIPDLSFAFYGNSTFNTLNNNGNVTTNANSFMANLWSYDNNGNFLSSSLTKFIPNVVYGNLTSTVDLVLNPSSQAGTPLPNYGNVRPLLLSNAYFSQNNFNYIVGYNRFLGNTNMPANVLVNGYSFYANITADGTLPNTNYDKVSQVSGDSLNKNPSLSNLFKENVAYTSYTFANYEAAFTDLGGINGLNSTNYLYTSVLPMNGNANLNSNASYMDMSDAYINTIVQYNKYANLSGNVNNVHQLTTYNYSYRYYISGNITRTGTVNEPSSIYNKMSVEGSTDLLLNLKQQNGNVQSVTKGNLEVSNFALFTYNNVNRFSPRDTFYPFYSSEDCTYQTNSNINNNVNYLFPGFEYTNISTVPSSPCNNYFFSYKDDSKADFVIEQNSNVDKNITLQVFGVDTTANVIKVAIQNPTAGSTVGTKSIPIRKVQFGRDNNAAFGNNWYTYVVCKVQNETTSYVVIMVKLDSTGTTLPAELLQYTPVTVPITAIQRSSGGQEQIRFEYGLRIFKPDGTLLPLYNVDGVKTQPLSLVNPGAISNLNDEINVQVGVYSTPVNNMIINYAYLEDVITKILYYTKQDYTIDGFANGYKTLGSAVSDFSTKLENNTGSAVSDSNQQLNALVPANTTRFYLDANNYIYIDVSNASPVKPLSIVPMIVDRGIEWALNRDGAGANPIVGRNLYIDNVNINGGIYNYIWENNFNEAGSGFYLVTNGKLDSISSRLIWQKISTNNDVFAPLRFNIASVSDRLAVRLFYVNPSNNAIVGQHPTILNIDLGNSKLLNIGSTWGNGSAGSLPLAASKAIRGFSVQPTAAYDNRNFDILVRADCYAIVRKSPTAVYYNAAGQVLFSQRTDVFSSDGWVNFDFNNNSISYGYASATAPVFGTNFSEIICYTHNGFGRVFYWNKDFVSNYETGTLPSTTYRTDVTPFGVTANPVDAYKVNPDDVDTNTGILREIKWDPNAINGAGKYYIELQTDNKIYFLGTGRNSLNNAFNEKYTLILYSGLRPLIINVLDMKTSATLSTVRTQTATFLNNADIFNYGTAAQISNVPASQADIDSQIYTIVLTNSNASGLILNRGLTYKLQSNYFNDNAYRNIIFGIYTNIGGLFRDFKFISESNAGNIEIPVVVLNKQRSYNPNQKSVPLSGTVYDTYPIRDAGNKDGIYCYMTVLKGTDPVSTNNLPFRAEVNPAKVSVYEAIDINNNGEIDIHRASNVNNISAQFALNNVFSELLFDVSTTTGVPYRQPKIIQQWQLDERRKHVNINGSTIDIAFNNKFSVGYNLDTFFVIQQNNAAIFDLITISTEVRVNNPNSTSVNSLVVRDTLPLIVKAPNSWAIAYPSTVMQQNNGNYSGLTFKLNPSVNIVGGEIVRLFSDNVIANNTNQWSVICNSTAKNYKLYQYDQERFAALLNEQLQMSGDFI